MLRDGEYIVLKQSATHDQFCALATALGMQRLRTISGDGERICYEDIWLNAGQTRQLNYVDDPIAACRYVWVRGDDCEGVAGKLRTSLEFYHEDLLIEAATHARDHDTRVDALYRMAIACPRFNSFAFNAFLVAVMDPSRLIRMAALSAMVIRAWPESLRVFRTSAEADPDEQVRALARGFYEKYSVETRPGGV